MNPLVSNAKCEPVTMPEVSSDVKNETNSGNIAPCMSNNLTSASGIKAGTPGTAIDNVLGTLPTSETIMYSCEICDVKFSSIDTYNLHLAGSLHKEKLEQFEFDNVTGTLRTSTSETAVKNCEVCEAKFSSVDEYNRHLEGSPHKKKLNQLKLLKSLKKVTNEEFFLKSGERPGVFRCRVCPVKVNTPRAFSTHINGIKHMKTCRRIRMIIEGGCELELDQIAGSLDSVERKQRQKKRKEKFCKVCGNLSFSSEEQYVEHMNSTYHMKNVRIWRKHFYNLQLQ